MVKMPSATRAGRSWDRMILSPHNRRAVSMTLPGELGVLLWLIVAHDKCALLLPGSAFPLLGLLTCIGLVDECSALVPQPARNYVIHEQRHGQQCDLVTAWGEGRLGFQYQHFLYQEEQNPDFPPSWTL